MSVVGFDQIVIDQWSALYNHKLLYVKTIKTLKHPGAPCGMKTTPIYTYLKIMKVLHELHFYIPSFFRMRKSPILHCSSEVELIKLYLTAWISEKVLYIHCKDDFYFNTWIGVKMNLVESSVQRMCNWSEKFRFIGETKDKKCLFFPLREVKYDVVREICLVLKCCSNTTNGELKIEFDTCRTCLIHSVALINSLMGLDQFHNHGVVVYLFI